MLLITVVGGIGYASGALFAGVLFGCSFLAMQNTLTKLGQDYKSLEAVFGFLVSAVSVGPATIGITMGKNPAVRSPTSSRASRTSRSRSR